ncbi:MAG: hypothetical protein DWQ04_14395 [Chloroflexi bacterium]|nr:MAG: hypothetical protein DWQ04_14395 [Chloroflexota bacterium]
MTGPHFVVFYYLIIYLTSIKIDLQIFIHLLVPRSGMLSAYKMSHNDNAEVLLDKVGEYMYNTWTNY